MSAIAKTQDALEGALRPGARITNARGVPGTLGCLGLMIGDKRQVLLTTHHVLFGDHSPPAGREHRGDRMAGPIGCALVGRRGVIHDGDAEVYVDCAIAELNKLCSGAATFGLPSHIASVVVGERVSKLGAATGSTTGLVVDVNRCESTQLNGRPVSALGQIVVRSLAHEAFTAPGDSGALLCNASGAIVGMLWGLNARGESVACPITSVMWILHLASLHLDWSETK